MSTTKVEKYSPVPKWLNEAYVTDILRSYFGDCKLIVNDLKIIPATVIGEGYCSVMTRIAVDYASSKTGRAKSKYLIKTILNENDPAADMFISFGIYTREMDMYQTILPQLNKLLHDAGDTEKLFAETIHVDRVNSSIIFEDLLLQNFVTANRVECLDLAHIKLALRKLAKIHATAAVLHERYPDVFRENFDRGLFNRHTSANEPVVIGIYKSLKRYVATQPELKDKYLDKLELLTDNVMEYGTRAFDANDKDFMTLTHGDFWTANMLFRYNADNVPQDVVPIDFQLSTWASPTIDLHYFFNTSIQNELRLHQQPELLQHYYYILRDTLKLLGYRAHIPSLYEFNLQFQARSFLALFGSLIFQPMMTYYGTEVSTAENLMSESEVGVRLKDSYFKSEQVQKAVHSLLPIFDSKGLLDKMD